MSFKTRTTEGTFYNSGPRVHIYALHYYRYAELLHNKKLMEKRSKKGIALTLIRMTKDEKVLAVFKGLLL